MDIQDVTGPQLGERDRVRIWEALSSSALCATHAWGRGGYFWNVILNSREGLLRFLSSVGSGLWCQSSGEEQRKRERPPSRLGHTGGDLRCHHLAHVTAITVCLGLIYLKPIMSS